MPEPRVESILLADDAFQQSGSLKWCLIGLFTAISGHKLPIPVREMHVFLRLRDLKNGSPYRLRFEVKDEGEVSILQADFDLTPTGKTDAHEELITLDVCTAIPPFLVQAGKHTVTAWVDGHTARADTCFVATLLTKAAEEPQEQPATNDAKSESDSD